VWSWLVAVRCAVGHAIAPSRQRPDANSFQRRYGGSREVQRVQVGDD
jgi:hypothetical protein